MEDTKKNLELITPYFSDFTAGQLNQLESLGPLYRDWNSKINVISRKDEDGLYEKHILHSLAIAAVFHLTPGMQVLDLGTGGGFPGIPLAVFFPDVHFHLVDSIGKKIRVVEAIAAGVALKNVTTQHVRAEEIKNKKFDLVVSRAVAPLGQLWKWSKPLLLPRRKNTVVAADESLPVPHGLICLKGGDLAGEIADSGAHPRMMEIYELFRREYFREKYILYLPS
jgi:16S rRNA (guanine527-N7)-methyltransferase